MKEKLKMLLVMCIIISMLVTSPATAFATVVTTTGTPATGYRVYHDIEDWGVLPDVEMTYFTMEGRTAFCIEAGGAIRGVSGNYQPGVENNIDVDYAISTITEDNSVQSQVAYLGYYSLDNPTMKDYVFTQMMIWQSMPEWYANGINSATGEYRSYFIDSTVRAEYKVWKAKIQKKIDTWKTVPSFDGLSKRHPVIAGSTITLSDENGVFEDYNAFSYIQDGITVTHSKGSNDLIVKVNKSCSKNVIFMPYESSVGGLKSVGAQKYDSKATANYVYTSDNSQDIGVYGTTDPVPLALSFSVQTLGSLKIIKASEGKLISGITFNVEKTDGTYTATVKTGADGTVTLADIPTGEYEISEVTPSDYVKHDTVTVTVEPAETAIADFENELQKGKIAITKKGSVFSGFTKTSQGIYKPSYTSANLAGAVYDVIAADDFKAADGTILQKKGTVVDTLTTGSNGRDTTNEIYLGTYILKEKVPPTGYVLDETEYTVTLTYAGEEKNFTTVSKTLVDKRQQVNVSLKKAMELDPYGQLLPEMVDNVSFGLYTEEDIYTHDGGAFIPADSLMWILDVDEKGRASYRGNLPEGRYYLKEVVTDPHYILSEEKYPIELRYDKTGKEFIDIVANGGDAIENEYVKCSLNIIKSDEETGVLLEGTGFKLFNEREEEIAQGYTDEKGFLEFDELPVGEYKVREFEASSGYLINQEERHITLTQQQISQDVQVENQIKVGIIGAVMRLGPESIQEMVIVPKTEDITGILFWLMLAGGSFFCIVYVLWILNRRGRIKGKEYKKKEYRKKEKRFVIPVMLAVVLAFTGTFSSITAMAASRITRVYEFVSQTEDFQYTDNQNIVIDEEEYYAVDISYEIIAEIDDVEDVPSIEKKKNKHVEKTKIEEKEKEVESEKVEEKLLPVTSVKVWEGCRQKPQIPESMVVYAEDEEGKKIETRVFLDKVEERESRNKSTFEIDAEFIGDKGCQYYLMGDMRVKVNPEEPTFQGYEEALLNYLHLDSQIYTITGGLWLGDFEQKIETGETVRYARFSGEARDLVDYTAYYKGSIPMWEISDFEAETTDFEAETTDFEAETVDLEAGTIDFEKETNDLEKETNDDKVTKTDIDEETERSKKYLVQATVTYEKDAPSIDYNVVKAVPLFLLMVIIVAAVTIFNLKRKVSAAT